jgi:hypothetical protein
LDSFSCDFLLGTPPKEQLSKYKKSVHMSFNFPFTKGLYFYFYFFILLLGIGLPSLLPDESPELINILSIFYFIYFYFYFLVVHMIKYDEEERYTARQVFFFNLIYISFFFYFFIF